MKEDATVLESAGRYLLKRRAVAAAQKGFLGFILTGGFIFMFFLIKPLTHWGGLRISDFGLLCFQGAGVICGIGALLILGSAFLSLLKLPKAPMAAGQTCYQFYNNLLGWSEFDERYLPYICLTTSAKEEYGSVEAFLKKWKELQKGIKGSLDHIDLHCEETALSKTASCTIRLRFKIDDTITSSYTCRPRLLRVGVRWYIDTPTALCVPTISEGEPKEQA